jgi:hypothetical protein
VFRFLLGEVYVNFGGNGAALKGSLMTEIGLLSNLGTCFCIPVTVHQDWGILFMTYRHLSPAEYLSLYEMRGWGGTLPTELGNLSKLGKY